MPFVQGSGQHYIIAVAGYGIHINLTVYAVFRLDVQIYLMQIATAVFV